MSIQSKLIMISLPDEIWIEEIGLSLNPSDLRALSLTCKHFASIYRPILTIIRDEITPYLSDPKAGMRYASKKGDHWMVEFFISKGADNWDDGMEFAAMGGHRELIDLFIYEGARNWNLGRYYAILGGHRDIEEFFERKLSERQFMYA